MRTDDPFLATCSTQDALKPLLVFAATPRIHTNKPNFGFQSHDRLLARFPTLTVDQFLLGFGFFFSRLPAHKLTLTTIFSSREKPVISQLVAFQRHFRTITSFHYPFFPIEFARIFFLSVPFTSRPLFKSEKLHFRPMKCQNNCMRELSSARK